MTEKCCLKSLLNFINHSKSLTMDKRISKILLFFYFCGFASCIPDDYSAKQKYFYSKKILILLLILRVGCISVIAYSAFVWVNIFHDTEGLMVDIIDKVDFVMQIGTHLGILLHAFFTKRKQQELYRQLQGTNNSYTDKVLQAFYSYLLINLLLEAFSIFIFFYNGIFLYYWLHFIVSANIIRFRLIQQKFYVDMLHGLLLTLYERLNQTVANNRISRDSEVLVNVEENRCFYSKITDLKKLVNDCFGYSLIMILVVYFVDIITNLYWVYLSIEYGLAFGVYIGEL